MYPKARPLFNFAAEIAEELDVLGFGKRIALLDQLRERVADPGYDHAPTLDAAEAVGAVFKWPEFEQGVDVEGLWAVDQAADFDRPGTRRKAGGVARRVALVGAEFVEIVVVGDVLEAGEFFARGRERALDCLQLGVGMDRARGRKYLSQLAAPQRYRAGGRSGRDEAATVEPLFFRSDFGRWDVGTGQWVGLANQHGEDLFRVGSAKRIRKQPRIAGNSPGAASLGTVIRLRVLCARYRNGWRVGRDFRRSRTSGLGARTSRPFGRRLAHWRGGGRGWSG